MCVECGCGVADSDKRAGGEVHHHGDHAHGHDHHEDGHGHDDHHHSDHDHGPDRGDDSRTIEVLRGILHENEHLAAHLREDFARASVFAANLVSSPGSGKTELLHRTMSELGSRYSSAAVTGDLATENDAERLASSGSPAKQILTGTMCHLEAKMVADAIRGWHLADLDYLFIENVGNLVCPGEFDLGEDLRVVVVSVTEGEDKPLKYPTLLHTADVVVISKIDLVEAVECDLDLLRGNVLEVRPGVEILPVSAKTGEGLSAWFELLDARREVKLSRLGEPVPAHSH